MGKRKDAQTFLKNIEKFPGLDCCYTYDDCNVCGFFNQNKLFCKIEKHVSSLKHHQIVKQYLEKWLATHLKKLPYAIFEKFEQVLDLGEGEPKEDTIKFLNSVLNPFGYEVIDEQARTN